MYIQRYSPESEELRAVFLIAIINGGLRRSVDVDVNKRQGEVSSVEPND